MEAFDPSQDYSSKTAMRKQRKEKDRADKEAGKNKSKKNKDKLYPKSRPAPNKMKPALAIDCGNVISITDTDTGGGTLYQKVMRGIIAPDCISAIKILVSHFGVDNTYVLSKCGTNMQQGTVIFLTRNNFFEETGLSPRNVIFCTERKGGEFTKWNNLKAPEDWNNVKPTDLVNFGHEGPRVANGKVGKGVIGNELKMTCLIDDRLDCHESFWNEGANCDDMRLVHFSESTNPNYPKFITLTSNKWAEVVDSLVAKSKPAEDSIEKPELSEDIDPVGEIFGEED